jgi:transcriptional regulator with XRE-family HTH domain
MIDSATLRAKRTGAGIAGSLLCQKIGMARSRLSDIERGYATPSPDEIGSLDSALDELIRAKSVLQKTAEALGWPGGVVR